MHAADRHPQIAGDLADIEPRLVEVLECVSLDLLEMKGRQVRQGDLPHARQRAQARDQDVGDARRDGCGRLGLERADVLGQRADHSDHQVPCAARTGDALRRELERWSESHPTHVAIFGAAMKYLSQLGPAAKLRLYHEVTVARADEQFFEYLKCHPATGMLRAL